MPFSPGTDKDAIHARIRGDPKILELMDLVDKPNEEIGKRIIKCCQWDDLTEPERRICIYFRPSRSGNTNLFTENVIQIDVHVPASIDVYADMIQERICQLLQYKYPDKRIGRFEVNHKVVQFDGQLGDLPTATDFVCVGSRFCFYSTI